MLNNHRVNRWCQFMLVLVLALGLLSGCKTEKPVNSNVGTDSIHAYMLLQCVQDGTTSVKVELSVGGALGPAIYLVEGDELKAATNGHSQQLERKDAWPNRVFYIATLDTDDPGTQVTVSFERPGYTPAPDSSVVLPEDIVIQRPQAGDAFSREDEITVSWVPSDGTQELSIMFNMTCKEGPGGSLSYAVSDAGSATYSVASLLREGLGNETCDTPIEATITLMREATGSLSAEYKSGKIVAQREVSVSVKITP
jgi:hypothetical protein